MAKKSLCIAFAFLGVKTRDPSYSIYVLPKSWDAYKMAEGHATPFFYTFRAVAQKPASGPLELLSKPTHISARHIVTKPELILKRDEVYGMLSDMAADINDNPGLLQRWAIHAGIHNPDAVTDIRQIAGGVKDMPADTLFVRNSNDAFIRILPQDKVCDRNGQKIDLAALPPKQKTFKFVPPALQ